MSVVFFIISIITLWAGVYCFPRRNESIDGIENCFAIIMGYMCYQCLLSMVLKYLRINADHISFMIINIFLSIVLWALIIKKRSIQKYSYKKEDLISIMLIALGVLAIGIFQFGIRLNIFNYECLWDSDVHLEWMREFADEHVITSPMYFMQVNTGIVINCLRHFDPYNTGCTAFVRMDVLILFLIAVAFWLLIRKHIKNLYGYIAALAFTALYLVGYPFNNMVFGTSYLGAGNLCVLAALLLCNAFYEKRIVLREFLIGSLILTYAMFISYVLFLPVTIGVTVFVLVSHFIKAGVVNKKIIIKLVIAAVVLSVILAVVFFSTWNISSLIIEGQIYRCFFTNFLPVVPFVVGAILSYKKQEELSLIFMGISMFYVFIFFIGVIMHKISGYYYYKNYYLLWLAVWYMAYIYCMRADYYRRAINVYFIGYVLLLLISMSCFNRKFARIQDEISGYGSVFGTTTVDNLFDLYHYNVSMTMYHPVTSDAYKLYEYSAELNRLNEGSTFYVGEYTYALQRQFCAIANQKYVNYFQNATKEECIKNIEDNSAFICVQNPHLAPIDLSDWYENFEVLYQNDAGMVMRITK